MEYWEEEVFNFPTRPILKAHYSILLIRCGLAELYDEGFHPGDPQPLAYPPPLFPVPDPEAFSVKPDLKGVDLAAGLDKMTKLFDGLKVVNQAEVGPDSFDLDLDDLPGQA